MHRFPISALLLGLLTALTGCSGVPEGATPVNNFSLQRYLGTWYEVARLDHRFERGLSNVTAEYRLRDDGKVRVVNRGFDADSNEWNEAEGKAKFAGAEDVGQLEVSFFGPFYSSYNIIELDHENYEYALIAGYNLDYLWILARSPELDPAIVARLVGKARELGFATDELIYVEHE